LSSMSSSSLSSMSSYLLLSVSASKVSASTNPIREYARKRKNSTRLTFLPYRCAVEIKHKSKSFSNFSVVLA
jgi:hypothetical protein